MIGLQYVQREANNVLFIFGMKVSPALSSTGIFLSFFAILFKINYIAIGGLQQP